MFGQAICNKCGYDTFGFFGEKYGESNCPVCGDHLIFPDIEPHDFEVMTKDEKEEYKKALRNNVELDPQLVAKRIAYIAKQRSENITLVKAVPRCQKCGSTKFTPVRKKFSILTGFATNKVDLICNNCGTKIK